MSIYKGTPPNLVEKNSSPLSPNRSLQLVNHSPTGFAWGYGGSGPAQLALALLLEEVSESTALAFYQQFKWDVIARFPQNAPWQLFSVEILAWLESPRPINISPLKQMIDPELIVGHDSSSLPIRNYQLEPWVQHQLEVYPVLAEACRMARNWIADSFLNLEDQPECLSLLTEAMVQVEGEYHSESQPKDPQRLTVLQVLKRSAERVVRLTALAEKGEFPPEAVLLEELRILDDRSTYLRKLLLKEVK